MQTRDPHIGKVPQTSGAVNCENLNALVSLLQIDHARVVIEQTYPFDKTPSAVTHVLTHHAKGKVAIAL